MRSVELGVVGISQVVMTDLEQPGHDIAGVRELGANLEVPAPTFGGCMRIDSINCICPNTR